jgi:hypothetical protein
MLFTSITRSFILLTLTLIPLTGCQDRQQFYYDFETDDTLDTLSWKCKTIFTLSDRYAASGQKCLKMELYPSPYPGVSLKNSDHDWSKHNTLNFNVHNQEKTPLRLSVRIDDTKDPQYNNRYNHTFIIKPGMNNIAIPLNSLLASGTNRKLNLSKIESVILFLVQPYEKRTLYLDYVRLE